MSLKKYGVLKGRPIRTIMGQGTNGGIITLLNKEGLKVHGVAYTKAQAQREDWTIVF